MKSSLTRRAALKTIAGTAAAIAAELWPRFEVEPAELERDVREFLEELRGRGWVVTA